MLNYNQYGFEYIGSCNCDGTQNEKYRNGIWHLRYRPSRGTFKFKKNGITQTNWISEEKALEFIKQNIHANP